MPETSIIIRTRNEEKHLGNLLKALGKQHYQSFEVIVVDSASTDRTAEIAKGFKAQVIDIESRDFTFGYSLNIGSKAAQGKFLVYISAHVLPENDFWLENLIAPLKEDGVAMTYGRQSGVASSKFSEKNDFKRLFSPKADNPNVPTYYANNANSALKKNLWEKRQFDEFLFGLEDIDWARAITQENYQIRYVPEAAIYHIHSESWAQVFNRYRREAIAAWRIGLPEPPQAKLALWWAVWRVLDDVLRSFPNWSFKRLEEILRFRYYQWKGSNQGWFKDRGLDINNDKEALLFAEDNQAVVIEAQERARLRHSPLPEMKPGDILIKVDYVGICRTDLEVLDGTLGYYRDGVADFPIVPGHEYSGTIARIGGNVRNRERFKIGERVVGECIISRGEKGPRREVGVINHDGAYSQYVVVPGYAVHKVPEGLDQKTAALTEPVAVVLRAKRRIEQRLSLGAKVAVIGAGPIGNLTAQVFDHGGYEVTVFDLNKERLSLFSGGIQTSTKVEGLGQFDVIVEVTGSKEVLEAILAQSRLNSTLLFLGFPYGDTKYNFENLVGQEKVIVGSVGGDYEDFQTALKLLPELDTKPFLEKEMPLTDFNEAWALHRTSKYLKIMLKP